MAVSLLSQLSLVTALVCLGLAVFVLSRNPRSAVNRSFALGMTALALLEFGSFMALRSRLLAPYLAWTRLSFAGEILLPGPWLAFSLGFGRSDPAEHLRRWRPAVVGAYLLSLLFLAALHLGRVVTDNLVLTGIGQALSVFLLLTLTATLANFEFTLRSADHRQRWRIKYLTLGLSAIVIFRIYVLSQILLFSSVAKDFSLVSSTVTLIGCGVVAASLVRHHILDVGVSVSRYVIYNSVTVVAVGSYLLIVGLAVQAIKTFGGDLSVYLRYLFVLIAVLVLAVILLSYNARRRFKLFVDRHFYDEKYDYRKEWLRLTDRLSSKLNVGDLLPPLANVMFETFWIRRALLWLAEDREQEFKLFRSDAPGLASPTTWDPRLVEVLKERDAVLDLEDLRCDPDLAAVPEQHWAMLRALEVATLVPLIVERQLVGILGLSRSHTGARLGEEDRELLKTMAKQAASSFLIAQLSERVVQSKELEAFHAFSTFLVHDLKNFVSMLSLVVQNMHRNFDKPEFKADALASISQTVGKMTRLMERLAVLSHGPDLSLTSTDLNELVRETLAEIRGSRTSGVYEDLQCVPSVQVDAASIKKVITNLILNAEDAVAGTGNGEIRVTTAVRDGMAALAVSDNGCGMTSEFLATRLFKPFSTTKGNGFGIGLYQCKSIVEAHGGRIEVMSEPGKGSSFTMLIPVVRD